MSTFSYAQAAKGHSTTQSIGSQPNSAPSQAPSTTSTQSRDVAATPSTRAPSVAISTTSNDGSQNTSSSSIKPESYSLNSNDSDCVSTSDKAAEPSSLSSEITEKVLGEVVPQSTERRGRGQTLNSQPADASDGKKPRKGKKSKTAEKESEQDQDKKENVPLKVELAEAPMPSVNIWTQRQEERAAKYQAAPPAIVQSHGSNTAASGSTNGTLNQASQDQKPKTPHSDGADATSVQSRPLSGGSRPSKKDFEQSRSNSNQGSRRAAPRGARANNGEDRSSSEALAPIASNTSSWPTPETAATGLKTQTTSTGKPEKEQKDESGPSKPRQKKEWTPMDFVPTVNFETPMPTRGPRGGRTGGSRGGRDASVRGSHSSNASSGNLSHFLTAVKFTNPYEDRAQENGATPGAASVAMPASKRGSVDVSASRKSQSQGAGKLGEIPSGSSKADVSKQSLADSANGILTQHAATRTTGLNQRVDETKSSQPTRDNGFHSTKDSSFQGQGNVNRNERPRGGARGRGGHSVVNGVGHSSQFNQGNPAYNYQANASANPRQAAHHAFTPGYPPMPYGNSFPAQSTGNQHRSRPSSGNNRSQGSARHQSRAAYPLTNMPYDPTVYSHSNGQFNPYVDPNHLLSGVLSQVEYYFSIDNLCKDWYLRKFMDSQGFVPLNVIAGFKRMQEIAADWQLIRIACDSSPHIEYIITDEGQDKVRRREQWEPWVLAMHVRHPTAQHDGPMSYRPFESHMAFWPQMFSYGVAPMFSPTGTETHFPHYVNGNGATSPTNNGANGHFRPADSQLSATVPEFSPIANPGMDIASQGAVGTSDAQANGLKADNVDKGSLPTGSHTLNDVEQIAIGDKSSTNGVHGGHEAEVY
ncbi:uncharacterized protein GGS22DRAFT_182345 [Annulohypoxylon maeteangense]|uniref:uncharacterized protein n=1 Tax=Annulohypoxylon maeteangense TaxID=1927788 RepID=UPI002007C0FF|nr:uncharacterized protein GGS22DRAFT_182345 [Annulohypoxylon maeteangense]KAI0880361.1 hypothetical protein GGS22DRAFT_182345 [Annulohypoxylon maeteangense]